MNHTTVIAYMALFVALGGTSYAATKLPNDSVTAAGAAGPMGSAGPS